MKIPEFTKYIPDNWDNGKRADRDYFFLVLGTLRPQFLKDFVRDVTAQRLLRKSEKVKIQEDIKVSDHWLEILMRDEFESSKYLSVLQKTPFVF